LKPFRTIIVGRGDKFAVKVDAEDYDFLMQWKWTFARSHGPWSGLVYARRSVKAPDGSNTTILMHRVVLIERMGIERPSELHFTDHENGHSLDNRRVNDKGLQQLQWLTHPENMAKRHGIKCVPISGDVEIPY
jgi:hypothetical protein